MAGETASGGESLESWRDELLRGGVDPEEADRLQALLEGELTTLRSAGLDPDEAMLVGVRRLGRILPGPSPAEARVALALAVEAGVAIKLPELFGASWEGVEQGQLFLLRNLSLFVLPFLAAFFAWKRKVPAGRWPWLALPFVAGAAAVNGLPFVPEGDTQILAVLHLPIALWLAVGVAHAGGAWRSHAERLAFVRFSGEVFIYYVLIALGGGVFMASTAFAFEAIGLDPESFVTGWLLPCGAMGAVVIAAWLVGAGQGVVRQLAPMLTLLFTPLFALLLAGLLVAMAVTGSGIDVDRDVLIGFDLLLVVVVGLLLYAISSRPTDAPPGLLDGLQMVLVSCALVVDALALWAIAARISDNRVAALGENLILGANLAGSAVLLGRCLRRRAGVAALQRWQTAFLPVYAGWAWLVVVVFPIVFGFR